jgi:hypothetical protein
LDRGETKQLDVRGSRGAIMLRKEATGKAASKWEKSKYAPKPANFA